MVSLVEINAFFLESHEGMAHIVVGKDTNHLSTLHILTLEVDFT